ncbi:MULTISPECIES: ABC transporter ATP-binding protein [unclassified Rhizobium]|uniref:ABC transporter ATP-binding protein n=1 Tax=unclassified Rhizobium TaxID=2613769 RepID=UPI00177D9D5A|nr:MULTISPECIES: ABC transporter ATP-binding protein [unclassified Rhizobium]MBD8689879.1 ABC transporter ATP-binding protein [Rhizobium sp. CFBP 13644]MBD8694469.1 ABC transporter ATP-binding protein [Rhizobium sp. CFBP 13717]
MPDKSTPPILGTRDASIGYGAKLILRNLDISIPKARFTVLLGPNGCGKSTLLRALAGLIRPQQGSVLLNGGEVSGFSRKRLAQQIGLLSQNQSAPEGMTVIDLVKQGRYPHRTLFGRWTKEDDEACNEALAVTDTVDLKDEKFDTLSGGQRQRAWIAMTLAQRTDVLLLDEPTTFLDLSHQIDTLRLARKLVRERGVTVVAVLHDINQAARYADNLVLLKNGVIVSEGSPSDILTPDIVKRVFDVDVTIMVEPHSQAPICVPVEVTL